MESAVEFDQQSGAIRKVDVERALSESGLGGDLRHRQSGQSGTPRNRVGRFQQLNDVVSLSAREADVAVRLAKPVGDSLVARRLPSLEMGLFASREYLAGRPASTFAASACSGSTRAGAGISILPRLLATSRPELLELPPPLPMPTRPVWVVTHRDLRGVRPIRAVRDWIVDSFSGGTRPQ